jgi:hypothetical protein
MPGVDCSETTGSRGDGCRMERSEMGLFRSGTVGCWSEFDVRTAPPSPSLLAREGTGFRAIGTGFRFTLTCGV